MVFHLQIGANLLIYVDTWYLFLFFFSIFFPRYRLLLMIHAVWDMGEIMRVIILRVNYTATTELSVPHVPAVRRLRLLRR